MGDVWLQLASRTRSAQTRSELRRETAPLCACTSVEPPPSLAAPESNLLVARRSTGAFSGPQQQRAPNIAVNITWTTGQGPSTFYAAFSDSSRCLSADDAIHFSHEAQPYLDSTHTEK